MTYKARFVHGSRYFNLDAGEFDLFQDFIFPAADEALNVSTGNVGSMSGGRVVSKTPQDRWWAWSVRILGDSIAQTHYAARRLSMWLSQSIDDKSDKVYFEYTPAYNVPAPIWGQHGAPYRFEVKAAIVDLDGSYYVADIPSKALILPISLFVAPYALGARQLVCQAKGGMIENTVGTLDGMPRGTIVASATTNKMTNPVFSHATPLNDWTAAADLAATANTNTDYILWGSASARVVRKSAGANYTFTQSIAAGNTNAHYLQAYVKREDGAAITSATVNLWYNASIATTYTALGNGWYMLSAAVTGIAAATLTGLLVSGLDIPIYVAGVQLAEKADLSPMTHGDMIGCAWTGTAHASTSTRTVAYARLPVAGLLNPNSGAIRIVIKHMAAAAGHSYDRVLFSDGNLSAYLENSTAEYYFTDGTNIISGGAAQTFTSGAIHVLHFVWSSAGLATYLNGALYDSGATFTPWTLGTYLYIGSNTTPAAHFDGTFLAPPALFSQALTTAQVLADYNDISEWVTGGDGYGQRLESLPYLWTKDGDNVVDNCTDATRNHYAIAAGIQGSTEAETEIRGVAGTDFSGLHLSNFATRRYINPSEFFSDSSGTADAAAVGGSAKVTSLSTSSLQLTNPSLNWYKYEYPEFDAMQFYMLARIKDATTGYIRIQPYVTSNSGITSGMLDFSRPYATGTGYRLFRTNIGTTQKYYAGYDTALESVPMKGYRNSGTANLSLDYSVMFPRPYLYCSLGDIASFTLTEKTLAVIGGGPSPGWIAVVNAVGDKIEFVPNKYNILQSLMGRDDADPALAYTLTYTVYITPRYNLL